MNMLEIKLIDKENALDIKGMEMVKVIRQNYSKECEEVLSIDKNKLVINDIVLADNEEKERLAKLVFINLVNKQIVENTFEDTDFTSANSEEIDNALKGACNFEHLIEEYEIYEKKKQLPEANGLSYDEIMKLEWDESLQIYNEEIQLCEDILLCNKNLYLWGNAGNGKSTFAANIFEKMGLKAYIINSVKNEYSLKGYFKENGEYQLSVFEQWFKNGGGLRCEEIDGWSGNGTLYMNSIIETNAKYMTLENGEVIAKHPDCYIIACANTDGSGKTVDYSGRNKLDKAFLERFTLVEFGEYEYVHKQIIKKETEKLNYTKSESDKVFRKIKKYCIDNDREMTCRLCVKISQLLKRRDIDSILNMLSSGRIKL